MCLRQALFVGQEGDHRFCGTNRGGCGRRFSLQLLADLQRVVDEAQQQGETPQVHHRESWYRRLSAGVPVDLLLREVRDGVMPDGYRPPL